MSLLPPPPPPCVPELCEQPSQQCLFTIKKYIHEYYVHALGVKWQIHIQHAYSSQLLCFLVHYLRVTSFQLRERQSVSITVTYTVSYTNLNRSKGFPHHYSLPKTKRALTYFFPQIISHNQTRYCHKNWRTLQIFGHTVAHIKRSAVAYKTTGKSHGERNKQRQRQINSTNLIHSGSFGEAWLPTSHAT